MYNIYEVWGDTRTLVNSAQELPNGCNEDTFTGDENLNQWVLDYELVHDEFASYTLVVQHN